MNCTINKIRYLPNKEREYLVNVPSFYSNFTYLNRIVTKTHSDASLIYSTTKEMVEKYKNVYKDFTLPVFTTSLFSKLIEVYIECLNKPNSLKNRLEITVFSKSTLNQLIVDQHNATKSLQIVSDFQNDYDRIVYSSAFRRLQDKAQVFSLEDFDFVRTRLTHSIEVESIAEQLVSKIYFKERMFKDLYKSYDVNLLSRCASLLHDIGNPPFGHYGEAIIRNYFKKLFESNAELSTEVSANIGESENTCIKEILTTERLRNDFTSFDGNAQAFRIVTHLQVFDEKPSLNLTYSTLLSIIKYPFYSDETLEEGKFGFFYSERDVVDWLSNNGEFKTGIMYLPCMIMESADDISYAISDIEDACKKGLITYEDIVDTDLSRESDYVSLFVCDLIAFYEKNRKLYSNPFEVTIQRVLQKFKLDLISQTAYQIAYDVQIDKHLDRNSLMENNKFFHYVDRTDAYQVYEFFKEKLICSKVYNSNLVSLSELEGNAILSFLLNEFTQVVLNVPFEIDRDQLLAVRSKIIDNSKEIKLFNLISSHMKRAYINAVDGKNLNPEEILYYRLKMVVDYVSGMTDSYAKRLYNKLNGK